ncbi:MAG: glutathione S-transferase family protein [Pseudomonadales bacterium]|nr:glutathione S-transferase family protein [Pseudomonadales bacterium]MDP4912310.1 glutathione S-transferase family protein [Pseudomonadales bacterium]MDP5060206.1 glutathione S-transferase family protein [Pseudomonadales bacterium]
MYQLYIANKNYSSWSLRPWLLMRALDIAFEEKLKPFLAADNFAAFRQFAPNGKVPCLVAGDQVVWDSMGIVEYLYEQHAQVWPAASAARTWARCASAEMHSGFNTLRNDCTMNIGIRVRLNSISPALQRDVERIDELWSQGLGNFGGPYLAGGKFTAVDAFYAPVVFRVRTYGLALSAAAEAYVARILVLPAMLDWEAAALAEPYRETAHEAEVLAAGQVLADWRLPLDS